MKKTIQLLLLFILLTPTLYGLQEHKEAAALKIQDSIKVDGLIDEAAWENAPEIGGFIQFQPERGNPSSLKTIVKILYDSNYIYFAFFCYDSEPEKIAARVTKRDLDIRTDDSVYVLLDTYHDKRNCYFFGTNPLGTQWDGRIGDNGLHFDPNWDGIWKSAASSTDYGWSAEFAVDFSSLKYEPGSDKSWGLNVGRGIPRDLEFSFWAGPLENPYKVSQYGDLKGLDLEEAQKKVQIIPHVITKVEQSRQTDLELGVDARYAFSQTVSGNLTINPDFATIEADQEKINLTRFELNLPEKRNFFLEGSEIFSQRIRLFYSRRISDIYAGAKVYGKSGGFEFSGMSAQTRKNEEIGENSANFSVFRLKKDVLKSSSIGFLAANKLVGGMNRGTAGFDTSLYFSDKVQFTGQFALSYGDFKRSNIAFFLRPSYDSATFHIHLRYTQLGDHFADNANAVGFVQDDNRHEFDSAIEKTFWIKKWGFERIQYGSNYNIYWGLDWTLRSWKIDQGLEFDLKNKFSLEVDHAQEYKLYEKGFRNHQTAFGLGYNTREWQSAEISYEFGRNYDLNFHLFEGRVNYKISEDFSLQYALERVIFNPDPEGESTWIHVIRVTHYFTNDLFLKLFYQINSTIEKKNIQVLFVYRFQPPFGSIQIAYQKGTALFGERGNQGHTVFIKLAYMF
ncbi:MAG: carbohydrate binding family 9 domain-containing protein [Candidatus Aminicenantes bacterium]|nr:carbohydrate binding family 9 domain-containing protein [Candidatus Aminicenantes bacterium]